MTVGDLIQVCADENIDPKQVRVVIGFVGGATFDVTTVDANEAGDSATIFLTITEEVS